MMRAQTRHEMSAGIVELLLIPASNEQLADVMFRANSGEDLTPKELYQFHLRTNALYRYWEDVHYQYRVGLYDDIEFEKQREAWRAHFVGSQRSAQYWCQVRTLYSPEFASEMDSLQTKESCK